MSDNVINLAQYRDRWLLDLLKCAGRRRRPTPGQVLWARLCQHSEFRAYLETDRQGAMEAAADALELGFGVDDVLAMLALKPDPPDRPRTELRLV